MEKENHLVHGVNLRVGILKEGTIQWLGFSTICTISSERETESILLKKNQYIGKWEKTRTKHVVRLKSTNLILFDELPLAYAQLKDLCKNEIPITVRYELPATSNYYFEGQFTIVSLEESTHSQVFSTYHIRFRNAGIVEFKSCYDEE